MAENWASWASFVIAHLMTAEDVGPALSRTTLLSELPIWVGSDQAAFLANAEKNDRLRLSLMIPPDGAGRSLDESMHQALEEGLHAHGAPRSSEPQDCSPEERLDAQLYRARLIGAAGLALEVWGLGHLAQAGCLSPEDSQSLRWWLKATELYPLQLLVPKDARDVLLYPAPVTLSSLIPETRAGAIIEYEAFTLDVGGQAPDASTAEATETTDHVASEDAPLSLLPPRVEAFGEEVPEDKDGLSPSSAAQDTAPEQDPPSAPRIPCEKSPSVPRGTTPAVIQAALSKLESTQGPKSLETIERLFQSSYMPLLGAAAAGELGADSEALVSRWAESFSTSFQEAYTKLSGRQRPTMMCDLPEVAARLGRLHGARQVELLWVDGLRYDVGVRVNELLNERLSNAEPSPEDLLLWSGLPATTATALELFGRGQSALADLRGELEDASLVDWSDEGRRIQRVKVGRRELLKLDLIEHELRSIRTPDAAWLESLAQGVAEQVQQVAESLPEETLLLVFGDHGFSVECDAAGRPRGVVRRGSRPEHILVPAYAWMLRQVH